MKPASRMQALGRFSRRPTVRFALALWAVAAGVAVAPGAPALAAGGPEAPITEACGGLAGPAIVRPGVVQLCGTLNPHASAKVGYYFAYSTGTSCAGGDKTPAEAEVEGKAIKVSIELTGLQPGSEYTYCLVATNSHGETMGEGLTFKTEGEPIAESPPGEVQTEPAEQTATGFKLKGKLNPENSPTTYYFIYKKSGEVECEDLEGCGPETTHGGPLTGDTQQEVPPAAVTGLTPGATYVYWLIARNAHGTAVGRQLTFTAPPGAAPSEVVTGSAEPTPSGYRLKGELNPDGLPTTYYYEYIGSNEIECLDTEPGLERCWHETAHAGPIAGDTQQEVSPVEVTGLTAGITYHYRLVASNADHTVWGNEASFTVGSPPVIDSVSLSHLTSTDATLEAQINTEGLETTYRFTLQPQPCSKHGVFYCELVAPPIPLPSGELLGSFVGQRVSLDLNSAGVHLNPGEEYSYSVIATSAAGSAQGSWQTFELPKAAVQPAPTTSPPLQPTMSGTTVTGTGNVVCPNNVAPTGCGNNGLPKRPLPKPLTRAQKLAKALKVCEKKSKGKREACKRQARREYGGPVLKATKR